MSSKKDFIPAREAQFKDWQDVFMRNATPFYKVWGIPDNTWKELLALQSDYLSKYETADNPNTRTSVAIERRQEARASYEAKLRIVIKGYITYNPEISDDQHKSAGLPVHDTKPTPVKKPTTLVKYTIDSSIIRMLRILFQDELMASKAKPDGVIGAEASWGILDTPPLSLAELTHTTLVTHSPFVLEFDESDRGKKVYFCLRWENTRGEKGPQSEILNAIIP